MRITNTVRWGKAMAITLAGLATCLSLACSSPDNDTTGGSGGAGSGTAGAGGGAGQDCTPRAVVLPEANFFKDISDSSQIRVANHDPSNPNIPINDHSRLAFADINGDGF
ncbi:MAG: hypothetical protein VB934_05615, partial [Polyangiaceae bacterium]